jgi:hypothetical protein
MIVTLVAGGVVLADYFLQFDALSGLSGKFLTWSVLISCFATALGGANILTVHARNIKDRRERWGLSAVLVVSLVIWFGIGVTKGTSSPAYRFIWENVYGSLSSTLFALNAFFIASAAYRSFRVRNVDSSLLLLAASVVMLGRVGLGELLYPNMPKVADWLMAIPGTAGMRGITIGGALGAITISARILLGLERGSATGLSE